MEILFVFSIFYYLDSSNQNETVLYDENPHSIGSTSNISCGNENDTLVLFFTNGTLLEIFDSAEGNLLCVDGSWYTSSLDGNTTSKTVSDLQALSLSTQIECRSACENIISGNSSRKRIK